jgi:hypothetical protein
LISRGKFGPLFQLMNYNSWRLSKGFIHVLILCM